MKTSPVSADLDKQLQQLAQRPAQRLAPNEIGEIVESVVRSMSGDLSAVDLKLYGEIEALSRFIESARAEIAAVRPDKIRDQDIPRATDELDAVVGATEEATNRIMDACEKLETLAGSLEPGQGEQISDAVTNIYEACNFQDITGQRINKVVKTLKHIEDRLGAILSAFGDEIAKMGADVDPAPPPPASDATLLNGPQMPDDAKRQEEIDAILASFG